jgi:hypothetical protein
MTEPRSAPRSSGASIATKLALSLLPAAVFVWILKSGSLPILPSREEFAHVAPLTLPLFIVVWCAMYVVRLSRWYWLLAPVERVPYRTVLRVGGVGLLFIALAPFRMGEVVRPLLIRRPPKLTFWSASGTVGGERIIDALCVSVLLLAALRLAPPMDPLPHQLGTLPLNVALVPRMAFVSALVFASVCVVMGVFYFQRAFARRVTEVVLGLVSPRLAAWVAGKIEQMAGGLGFLEEPKNAVPFLLATAAYWLLNAASWWILARGCGFGALGFWGATATMGVVALGILVPATPGFFGAFQFATFAGLAMYLKPDIVIGPGAVYAFLSYVMPIGMTVLAGIACVLAKPSALLMLASDPGSGAGAPAPGQNLAGPDASS